MNSFIISVMVAITAYYACKWLDKLIIYLKKLVKEK